MNCAHRRRVRWKDFRRIDSGLGRAITFRKRNRGIAGSGGRAIADDILLLPSQSLVRSPPGRGCFYPFRPGCHNGFLFSKLQKSFLTNIFILFAVLPSRETAAGCYIDFSGFSTSRVLFAQECFLYTTFVTASTAAHPKQKHQQENIQWRRYLTAAPMPWLVRVWC
jgi:hypothetical protein